MVSKSAVTIPASVRAKGGRGEVEDEVFTNDKAVAGSTICERSQ